MKKFIFIAITLSVISTSSSAAKNTTLRTIAKEPVTMMDLGILKMNASLSRTKQKGLKGATIRAKYNAKRGTIDIKVSKPIKKASKNQCKKIINDTKKIFLKNHGKKKTSNIYHYFLHEGTSYTKRINWNDLGNHVVITAIVITRKNYQDSVYCQSKLMKNKVTY